LQTPRLEYLGLETPCLEIWGHQGISQAPMPGHQGHQGPWRPHAWTLGTSRDLWGPETAPPPPPLGGWGHQGTSQNPRPEIWAHGRDLGHPHAGHWGTPKDIAGPHFGDIRDRGDPCAWRQGGPNPPMLLPAGLGGPLPPLNYYLVLGAVLFIN